MQLVYSVILFELCISSISLMIVTIEMTVSIENKKCTHFFDVCDTNLTTTTKT